MVGEGKPRAVIVGGSIAGILSAHVLTLAGWNVTVLEKTNAPHRGSPTGAGLGLDPLSQRIRVMASGTSVTMKVSSDMIQKMHQEAEKVWTPELFKVLKETKKPFLNVIYDGEPLGETFWDNVVLVGDVAHPTTPHCLRSTNMSILDVAVLGKCLEKFGAEKLRLALEEYQFIRLPVTSKQVLHAR
ncbi:hypothetical protein glysoja_039665 [Glycine soja]|uniref:FAD-binding domain-containing protein n=1 Tax=Glycine soja TaxID=3848 RepID=A0A0B2RGV8_GLYSO|nr:hypothetical protein glysoja_039665 [Glycine soja]